MKKIITSPHAPAPIGPYSQAVQIGNMLFTSGQIALNPATGALETEDIVSETERVMKNLSAVLEAADMNFEHVVKTTIFLHDMEDFAQVNEVYGRYFNEATAPARETVAVKHLPKSVHVEISMIAVKE
jgi:2-iminobutanoate/2-iminopropanoate deaminase